MMEVSPVDGRTLYRDAPPFQKSHMPKKWIFLITLSIGVGMTVLNLVTIFCVRYLVRSKFTLMQMTIDAKVGVGPLGVLVLVLVSMFFAFVCLGSIFFIAPDAAGSGAPENKGWLNGSDQHEKLWTWRNMFVRAFATIMSNASGFPVGREGPSVTMGSNFAYCVTDLVASKFMQLRVNLDSKDNVELMGTLTEAAGTAALIVDQERFAALKRYMCTIGGACGMCLIFDSPIGGIVYMLEEMGTQGWSVNLTFSAFGVTVLCDVLTRLCLQVLGMDLKNFVIFQVDLSSTTSMHKTLHPWDWVDIPFFLIIAVMLGPFAAFHTELCLRVGKLRQKTMKHFKQPRAKLVDGIIFAAFCAALATCVSYIGSTCQEKPVNADDLGLEFIKFTCQGGDDMYSTIGSLLVTTSEAAMKLLISRNGNDLFTVSDLILSFVTYTMVNILLTGVPVPSGNFTGTMLIGGFFGRAVGNLVGSEGLKIASAKPGVYAMMGSAGMLCGFKRMSMAVVLFIAECGDDWALIPPLAMVVFVALFLCKQVRKIGYDEEQMEGKGIHVIEEFAHKTLYDHVASELIDPIASGATLQVQVSVSDLGEVLEEKTKALYFPIIRSDSVCVGVVPRERLETAMKLLREAGPTSLSASLKSDDGILDLLLVTRLMDPTPLSVQEDMLAPRVYTLFARAGTKCVSVVSETGQYRGLITRSSIVLAAKKFHEP